MKACQILHIKEGVYFTQEESHAFLAYISFLTLILCKECCCCLVSESHLNLRDPMDRSLPGSSVHGISQTRIPDWVAISFSRVSSQPRDWTCVSCIGRQILYHWATLEAILWRIDLCVSHYSSGTRKWAYIAKRHHTAWFTCNIQLINWFQAELDLAPL